MAQTEIVAYRASYEVVSPRRGLEAQKGIPICSINPL
jgi:hypothetical protein